MKRSILIGVLIVLAFGLTTGRVCSVEGFNGDNDRSRWATVRALVEEGTYVIGWRVYNDDAGTDDIAYSEGTRLR